MPEFLELLPPGDALAVLLKNLEQFQPGVELIPTASCPGRVTAVPLTAPESLPAFPRSTVDGYAVLAASTFGASDTLPAYLNLVGEVPMGGAPTFSLKKGQTALIHTGGMLPQGASAVVMIEYTQIARPGEIEVLRSVAVNENILQEGEDIRAGQHILSAGVRLRPAEIGGLLALGIQEILVTRSPRVGILSSGDEVIPPAQVPRPGQVRDVNSYSLSALVEQHGGKGVCYGIVPDRAEVLKEKLAQALQDNDLIVITAGSSASVRDLTADVIQSMGKPGVLVHGVNVRPGKPTILAVCDGKPVIGLPGNPVSALVIAGLFVVPVVEYMLGMPAGRPQPSISARLTLNIASQAGREDWIPVRLVAAPQGWLAEPVFYKSNLIFTLVRADGLVHIPPSATGLEVGAVVQVLPL